MGILSFSSSAVAPIPDRLRIFGVLYAPAERITSLRAATRKRGEVSLLATSTPIAVGISPASNNIRTTYVGGTVSEKSANRNVGSTDVGVNCHCEICAGYDIT